MSATTVDLGAPGWLVRLLELWLELRDPGGSARAIAEVRAVAPEVDDTSFALRLAERRLRESRLRPGDDPLPATMAERLRAAGVTAPEDQTAAAILIGQWEVLDDVATLIRADELSVDPRDDKLAVLAVTAMGLSDYKTARKIHKARQGARRAVVGLARLARAIEDALPWTRRSEVGARALAIGAGAAAIDARKLARLAVLYHEVDDVDEARCAEVHGKTQLERDTLAETLMAIAWADEKIVDEERQLLAQQAELIGLAPKELLDRLDVSCPLGVPTPPAELDEGARRFVIEQSMLLALVDEDIGEGEHEILTEVARRIGAPENELETLAVEVTAFYDDNRDRIRAAGELPRNVGVLQRLVIDRATRAIRDNLGRLVTEIKETGELAKLLSVASVRPLTTEESAKVKSQLLDICKTIPALAVFALPGGGLILPILIKLLPFNILPTAFAGDEAAPTTPSGVGSPEPPAPEAGPAEEDAGEDAGAASA